MKKPPTLCDGLGAGPGNLGDEAADDAADVLIVTFNEPDLGGDGGNDASVEDTYLIGDEAADDGAEDDVLIVTCREPGLGGDGAAVEIDFNTESLFTLPMC